MDSGARWPHDAILHAWWVEPGRLLPQWALWSRTARYGPAGAKSLRSVSRTPPELGTSDDATPQVAVVVGLTAIGEL
jgi:hypothetical protein